MEKLSQHPLFEIIDSGDSLTDIDPCIKLIRESTDEARKVLRQSKSIWHGVFRKRTDIEAINKSVLSYLN